MSEAKFTKGPWFLTEYGAIKSDFSKAANKTISASGVSSPWYKCEEAEANAALIAAAPEMYEMLQAQSRMMHKMGFSDERDVIDMLLAKARGKS